MDASVSDRSELARPPAELLRRATMAPMFRAALLDWAWIAVLIVLALGTPLWLYPLWAVLIAGRLHALGVIMHDLVHLPIRKKTFSVRVLEVLTSYPMATTLDAFRYQHRRHHAHTSTRLDPYFQPKMHGSAWRYVGVWLRQLLTVPAWIIRGPFGLLAVVIKPLRVPYGRIFHQDKSDKTLPDSREILECAREELGQVIFHAVLIGLTVWQPVPLLLAYWIPLELSWMVAGLRFLSEHTYRPFADQRPETVINETHDHHLDALGQLVVAPHNVGYHICHHLHPEVAYQDLPALRDWYRETYPDLYPSVRPGIFATIFGRRQRAGA